MADRSGRSELRSSLQHAVQAAHEVGRARIVRLVGEAGIGKTTLAAAAAVRARELGMRVWAAGAADLDRVTPYALLARVCDDRGERMFDLDELRDAGSARTLAGLPLGVAAGRFETVESIAATVEASCSNPTLLVLEDLQWADPASLAAIQEVASIATSLPVVLVLTRRTGVHGRSHDQLSDALDRLGADEVEIGPLTADEVDQLLEELCGGRPSDDLTRRAEGASGNPFLLREYAVGLLSEGRLAEADGEVDLVSADVPAQLRSAVALRVDGLDAETADVVRAAAVLGSVLDVGVLSPLLDRSPLALSAPIRIAVEAGLLEADGHRLAFRHELVREAVYQDVPGPVRSEAHRRTAAILGERNAPAALVGAHLVLADAAGDTEAIERLRLAAVETAPVAPDAALEFLDRAQALSVDDLPTRIVIEQARLEALMAAGRLAEAEAVGRWLLQVTPAEEHSEVRVRLGALALIVGDGAAALEHLRAADAARRSERNRPLILALCALASVATRDFAEACRLAGEAAVIGERIGERVGHSAGLALRARLSVNDSCIADGLRETAVAVAIADTDPTGAAHQFVPCLHHGVTAFDADQLDLATRMVARGNDLAGTHRIAWSRPLYATLAAACHHRRGELDAAEAEAGVAIDLAERLSSRQAQMWAEALLSLVAVDRGEVDAATHWAEAAWASWESGRSGMGINTVVLARGRAGVAAGDADRARRDLATAWELFEAAGLSACNQEIAVDLARLARLAGDDPTEAMVVDGMATSAAASGLPAVVALAAWVEALATDDALGARRALERLRRTDRRLDVARWLADGADVLAGGDDPAPYLREALATFDAVGATALAAPVRARLGELGQPSIEPAVHGWGALTATECEIAGLLAEGLTNAEIAQRRGSSRRTVESHLGRIYRKLGIEGRVKLTVEAAAHFRPRQNGKNA
ncbi:MAG: AAA family ATPase [Actinomycetota bacterium]